MSEVQMMNTTGYVQTITPAASYVAAPAAFVPQQALLRPLPRFVLFY